MAPGPHSAAGVVNEARCTFPVKCGSARSRSPPSDLIWLTMPGAPKPKGPGRKRKLSIGMTLPAFDNGYWYATELRAFALNMEIPFASKLRKDQLEAAIKDLLFADGAKAQAISVAPKQGPRDVDRGLSMSCSRGGKSLAGP